MKVYEIPVPAMEFFARINEGGAYSDPLIDVTSVTMHEYSACPRIMAFNTLAPETDSFLFKLQEHKIVINICRCGAELKETKTNWGYSFE